MEGKEAKGEGGADLWGLMAQRDLVFIPKLMSQRGSKQGRGLA